MKRLKTPLNFRIQNFMFVDSDEIFWTSANKTVLQKIKRLFKKDKTPLCNTSRGFTLPIHGQNIRNFDGYIEHYTTGMVFSIYHGGWVFNNSIPQVDLKEVRKMSGQYLQGIAFKGSTAKYAVFGKPSKLNIEVVNLETGHRTLINYKFNSKWWWKYWEAEGIQFDKNGKLWIGISVKSKFGFIVNYIKEIK